MTSQEIYIPSEEEFAAADALAAGRYGDPFAFLGSHPSGQRFVVRAFLPGASQVDVLAGDDIGALRPVGNTGLFVGPLHHLGGPASYRLRINWGTAIQETEDPYAFGPVLGELDLHLFSEGTHWNLAEVFGSRVTEIDGVCGVHFAVWAPNARRVSVVGDFNSWDGRRHPMRLRHSAGVWEIFIPRLIAGERYKYEIVGADGALLPLKADPLARLTEKPPATASHRTAAVEISLAR